MTATEANQFSCVTKAPFEPQWHASSMSVFSELSKLIMIIMNAFELSCSSIDCANTCGWKTHLHSHFHLHSSRRSWIHDEYQGFSYERRLTDTKRVINLATLFIIVLSSWLSSLFIKTLTENLTSKKVRDEYRKKHVLYVINMCSNWPNFGNLKRN